MTPPGAVIKITFSCGVTRRNERETDAQTYEGSKPTTAGVHLERSNTKSLRTWSSDLFRLSTRSRGKVILRELVQLRHTRSSGLGFPLGREFRLFLYKGEVLAFGYYWEGDDPLRQRSSLEEHDMLTIAKEAARRVPTPYLAVDVGQLEDGRWIVIEVGDAQFCGASQVSLWALWNKLASLAMG
jgi:hypothetical protein